jgi:hypothetical protein
LLIVFAVIPLASKVVATLKEFTARKPFINQVPESIVKLPTLSMAFHGTEYAQKLVLGIVGGLKFA